MKTHETDLPTNKTPTQAQVRFPRPHENRYGTQGDQPPPPRRPESPFKIKRTFSKEDRLLTRSDFKRLAYKGTRLVGCCMCIDWAKGGKGTRLGISASTRYGNAPERNRFKRLIREAFRLSRNRLPLGVDLNVIPRKLAKKATFSDIQAELVQLLC